MSAPRFVLVVAAALTGCGDGAIGPDENDVLCEPFAVDVVSFSPGANAGFGADGFPAIVLGHPEGKGNGAGSTTDVLSLGIGGSIVLELGCAATDGDGVDLVVYENAFAIAGSTANYTDAAEVAVSVDGKDFVAFACTPPARHAVVDDGVDGCAGMASVLGTSDNGDAGAFPAGGGDGFDLATVGIAEARFVRITDVGSDRVGNSAGFDLDAVAAIIRGRRD